VTSLYLLLYMRTWQLRMPQLPGSDSESAGLRGLLIDWCKWNDKSWPQLMH